ncbi:ABC transporter ATP-binding protein [Candidatus Atribacteria bacterium RBG_19FT_COMBO_35_14]|uniref:ABC transporter ATP-binding protein n=1 Tax=Candidatus Sediminicultor quintus TaxID=1797291 RepID=A0A1F5AAX5_9BACT|nr:MAG: ABC transporter ATP-binding protein [Candidatus Atribacteria bacterium RBG_19FT_COMBO_35_14]OGD36614.1 MAG: ABC transporter ATP-binding protein [Candidatus Atribacteria bacterium RBG_16_35_8]
MLKIDNLNVFFGGIHALKGISFDVPIGKVITLIGANGAGKSTTLRTICGLIKPREGKIKFSNNEITNIPTDKIVKKGIALIPEGRKIFPNLTVQENLTLGAFARTDKKETAKDLEWVYELFPRVKERLWQRGGTLSGGEQQMLAVARGLMSRPKLLMLDEPSLGLAPLLVKEIFDIIQKIHDDGITVLLVEQNAFAALKIADYAYVLETGKVVLQGTGEELLKDERVKKAYLGE